MWRLPWTVLNRTARIRAHRARCQYRAKNEYNCCSGLAAWRELTELMNVAPLLQRQVFMLDGATGLPALGAGLVRTGMPDGLGSTNSCKDRDRLLLLADTEEVVEATQPSGARLNPLGIPRGCSLQRSSSTSARPLFEPRSRLCPCHRTIRIGRCREGGSVLCDCGLRSPRACRGDRGRAAQTWELPHTRVYKRPPVQR